MSRRNPLVSLRNLIFSCSFRRSDPSNSLYDSYLPSSIIFEILLKLPIKSIIRFRRVCKTWNNLISEKYFATLYFKNPPFTVIVKSNFRVDEGKYSIESSYFLEIGLNGDNISTPFNLKAILDSQGTGNLNAIGSYNGLLCLLQRPKVSDVDHQNWGIAFNNEVLYIMNPILGEVMMLPQVNRTEDTETLVYGFGFSTQSDHYKVLRVATRRRDGHKLGEIFTIGLDHKWRSFEDSSLPFRIFSYGITLKGVLYFVCDDRHLFAFDIEKERGYQIPLPSEFHEHTRHIVFLVCNGNICLSDNSSKHQVVIWTMKRYGIAESWSKEIILISWISSELHIDPLIPITTLRNGDLLMSCQRSSFHYSKGLISFNQKTKECRKLEVGDGEGEYSYIFGYVPTFFSLSTL